MQDISHEHFMREALKQAVKAFDAGEIPVGAVVVFENRIIARAHNQMETLHDPTAHAEMIALTQASEALSQDKKDHRGSLEKAVLYATLEPCAMCAGALVVTKCSQLVYGSQDARAGCCGSLYNVVQDDRLNHRLKVVPGILAEESRSLLQAFFKALRKDRR
ncbi:MAG TPA: tRNA adenosine(34) deaminase TadA [Verrucomicrobiae bacterium]|jgi:tRNA(adenine34) deaminase|nr:tRNA adenosine(34) deaminase TadA [Verrucomicrobiae bacterium]